MCKPTELHVKYIRKLFMLKSGFQVYLLLVGDGEGEEGLGISFK